MTTWLSLALAVITLATPALTSEPRVVCYYTNWSVYRPGTAKFNPQNINPYLCTHLIYAFGGFTKDNTLKPFDKYQDIEKGGYAKFTGLKTYNKNLKTMLAIGGWNEGSSRFSPMVAAKERRKEFVKNAIKFLRQNRFDGLDLDWEYPAFRDGGKPKDREHYARLVRELREEFDRESEKTGRPRLLLTMAVPAGIEYIQKGFDIKTLNRYLDWMNLLTYDYHSAFEPAVNHHAPLFPLEEPNEYSVDNELNIDYTIKFYLENGADRDKLVLGIPTYGRSYTLFNPDAFEVGSPADGPGEQGDATREKGYLAYYEICEALKPKVKKRSASDEESEEESEEEEEDLPWVVMHPNPSAMGPVAYKGNQWVGYDDTEIVKKKAEYVAENGLGGIMFWSIDNDDFRGTCHGKPYPLIEAAKEAYIVKLGSTDNAIVTDRPRSTTSRSSKRRNRPRASTTTTVKPSTTTKASKRKSGSSLTSTTPSWNVTPEPPTTPDPGSDFKCTDEGFFQHPRDCKKYFWCLDSGPSNLGIVAHQFTCPSGLFFNKAADSCDFARNVLCKMPSATTKAPTSKAPTSKATTSTTSTTTTTRRPIKLSTKSSSLFRTTTTTTAAPEVEEEYEDEVEDAADIDAEDPRVIKELIDLIKKVGGVEQLEKHLHLAETSMSTDEAVTTTPSSFNKRLYQKVLERTRGRTKLTGNSLTDALSQTVRRGPQNAGLDATSDKDKLLRRDRPQYTTINRARSSTSAPESEEEETEEEIDEAPQQLSRSRAVETQSRVATTAKPLQYVNIRRARPTTVTSDTADDTASRNALFERSETHVTVSNSPNPNSLDIVLPARDNIPEYVTIRRQRPTTEEATTVQYQNTEPEPEESQETALEREISSPGSQPQYTSIIRSRSTTTTTTPTPEEITPEPTTVLAVQISSLLNSPSSSEVEEPETTVEVEATTTSTTSRPTTTTTKTTPAPPPTPPRRQILRRRGTTTTSTTTPAPVSPTQNIKRPNFLRRTKATSPPDTVDTSDTTNTTDTTEIIEITTTATANKFTRRGGSKFKSRTQNEVAKKDAGKSEFENRRRPSLSGSAARSERPVRNFVRRRPGGANAPYNPESPVLESSLTFFWVMPPPEQRPTEYPRPLLLQYNMIHDSHLSTHTMEQIRKSIKYYFNFADETFINFKDNFKPDITFLDKLKFTLMPKFPREQSDGLLWHFIRGELGCASEHDDKLDLDALLAVPQPIPASKPSQTTSIPNFPSVSTLQQMVSRPAGVPPINVSSGIGSGSPHKFETPPLNIPGLPTSSKSSKSTSSLPSTYPTGLDMLTSMALGLGTTTMPLPLGASSLESLAAANSMLPGLTPGMSTSLAASLTGSKMPDPPSYAASLQNLTSSIGSYEKTSTSTSTSTTSATPIPASIASNLMMSSADIANALFSASKYSSAGILGIPDPMSKSTLAANNMFLSPSLIKMQESLLKPLSSSSPISSKAGLDQSVLMKSPHDLLKGNKDYLPPDFGSIGTGKPDVSMDSMKHSESVSSKIESSKSDSMDVHASDYSLPSRVGGDSFLNQMLELTKKTTMPDYMTDYSQPLKLSKAEELASSASQSSHSYSNTASMVDTIAQVAMGNYDEPIDYGKEQDYSTSKIVTSENEN